MNFLIDNNLTPALARAINELSKPEGHRVIHLTERFPANTPDTDWITTLASENEWVVISQDKFTKGNAERIAFRESGLPIFCLAKQWGQESYWKKAHNLVRWWPAIIHQSERISGGAAFRVSWRFIEPGKFEQIRI